MSVTRVSADWQTVAGPRATAPGGGCVDLCPADVVVAD